MKTASFNQKSNQQKGENLVMKSKVSSFRGFISIDQEMGREIALMFFYPSQKNSLSASGHLAGKL